MDHMVARCVYYVKVCTLDKLEHSNIYVLTVISFGTVMLSIHHDRIVSMYFGEDTSAE